MGNGSGDGAGTGDSGPRVIDSARPPYPPAARRAGWEGAVALRVHVAANGSVTVEVRATSGHEILDEAAAKAVGRWRFAPATKAGRPIASLADLTIRFLLDDYR